MSKSRTPASSKPGLPRLSRLLIGGSLGLLYLWCMLLPLVGKAGSQSPQARENFFTVLVVLLTAFSFALLSCWQLRKLADLHPGYVKGVYGLCVIQAGCLLLLLGGVFGV